MDEPQDLGQASQGPQDLFIKTARSRHLWEKWNRIYDKEHDGPIIAEAKKMGVEFDVLPEQEAEKMYQATDSVWDWYVQECEKQGTGAEAREVRKLIQDRFEAKRKKCFRSGHLQPNTHNS